MLSIMEFRDFNYQNVDKFMHKGKPYAMMFRSFSLWGRDRHRDSNTITGRGMVASVSFHHDCAPSRYPNEPNRKVVSTGVLNHLSEFSKGGESFGDFFRFIGAAFDKLDMDPAGETGNLEVGMKISFMLFDAVHEYFFLPWDDWVMMEKFWKDQKKDEERKTAV